MLYNVLHNGQPQGFDTETQPNSISPQRMNKILRENGAKAEN